MSIEKDNHIFTGRNEVLAKVIFSQASVCPQGGFLQILGGVPPNFRGGGGVFFGRGGSSKFSGGSFWGVPPNFRGGFSPGIQSTFGRYASYWNAFLFQMKFC